jgi:hypothetical protein
MLCRFVLEACTRLVGFEIVATTLASSTVHLATDKQTIHLSESRPGTSCHELRHRSPLPIGSPVSYSEEIQKSPKG